MVSAAWIRSLQQRFRHDVPALLWRVGGRAAQEPAVSRVAAHLVTKTLARAFAVAGERRTSDLVTSAAAKLARVDHARPAFRLSSELAASGLDGSKVTAALERLGGYDKRRYASTLATIVGNAAGASLRHFAALRRHEASPQTAPPPVRNFILATTVHCNLRCVGCYTQSERTGTEPDDEIIDGVLAQGKRLGLLQVSLVGKGEPFLSKRASDRTVGLLRRHPDLLFQVFTNAVAISERTWAELGELSNVTIATSINGLRDTNDDSRGTGVFDAVMRACMRANAHGIPHGFSVTVTARNYEEVTSRPFISLMEDAGHAYGLFFKYGVLDPTSPEDLALSPSQVRDYEARLEAAGRSSPALLVDPDVVERGIGCRARSGALLYVDLVTGSVSPCVRTPFSPPEANILTDFHHDRLVEVLCTPFFRRYRSDVQRGVTCSSHGATEYEWFLRDPDVDSPTQQRIARDVRARGHPMRLPVLS